MKVVPPNFGYVEEEIFRCGSPAAHHLGFLSSLNLKTCILLDDRPNELFVRWLDETGVRILWPLMMMPQTVAPPPMLLSTTNMRSTGAPHATMSNRDAEGAPVNSNNDIFVHGSMTAMNASTFRGNSTRPHDNNTRRGDALSSPETELSRAQTQPNTHAGGGVAYTLLNTPPLPTASTKNADCSITIGQTKAGVSPTPRSGAVEQQSKENHVNQRQELVSSGNPVRSNNTGATLTKNASVAAGALNSSNNVHHVDDSNNKIGDTADKQGSGQNKNSNNNSIVSNAARFLKESFADPFVPHLRSPIMSLEPAYIKIHPAPDEDNPEPFTEKHHGEQASPQQAPMYMCNAPFGSTVQAQMSLSEPVVVSILHVMLDPSNYPLLITGAKGRFRTGIVCGCLRKLQSWNLVSILEEYRRYAGDKARAENEEFIELFDKDLVNLQLPNGRKPTILYNLYERANV